MTGRIPTMISDECEKLETIQASEYPGSISEHKFLRLSSLRTQTRIFCKSLDKKLQTGSFNKLLASELSIIFRL